MIEFLLNGVRTRAEASPGTLVLDWLRHHRRLTGTKEGCKEGDCGACSVMIGQWDGQKVDYKPVTSCLMPLGELQGRHLVTVEGLNLPSQGLNPVQQAMVDSGGSQCGFCTPGFIVSMCWYMMHSDDDAPQEDGVRAAISGNLCRCTGYGSITRASSALVAAFGPGGALHETWQAEDRPGALAQRGLLPSWWSEVPARMAALNEALEAEPQSHPADASGDMPEFVIAGGTDLYVQRGEEIPEGSVAVLGRRPAAELSSLRLDGDVVRVGALTTFEDFANHALIRDILPTIGEDMALIASLPIRNRATLAGNLVNASPIGDMTIFLLALDATVHLQAPGKARRSLPLRDLYLGYKTLARVPEELVVELSFPMIDKTTRFSFEKVSKRRCLDIATVNAAARLAVDDDGVVRDAHLSLGGVAAVPLYLRQASAWLRGRELNAESALKTVEIAMGEIAPISDVRGSARYKRLLARQLTLAHFVKLHPERVSLAGVLGERFEEVRP